MARVLALALAVLASAAGQTFADPRLAAISARGYLNCGLPRNVPGFAVIETAERAADGFDADFCRALAVALFGAADRVRFVAVETAREFLASPELDVVFHGLTWNFTRELTTGLGFGPVTFYDGQAFLVRADRAVDRLGELGRGAVCVEARSHFARALEAVLPRLAPDLFAVAIEGREAAEKEFFAGHCDALTADASMLFAAAAARAPALFRILPERISKEPLAPVVRAEDGALLTILRWTIYATIYAEELGLSSATIAAAAANATPGAGALRHLFAATVLDLAPDWPIAVVSQIGNYGEIYARHFQRPGRTRLERGANAPWGQGGLLYAPPLR